MSKGVVSRDHETTPFDLFIILLDHQKFKQPLFLYSISAILDRLIKPLMQPYLLDLTLCNGNFL